LTSHARVTGVAVDPNALDRLQRWFGLMVVGPALIPPIYQQFLHGDRDAAAILPRADGYLAAHMLGAHAPFAEQRAAASWRSAHSVTGK
jgi:hypothetical protein